MNHCTKEQLIAFERRIADLWEAGELPYLIHLSGGNEEPLIEIFREIQPGDWVFSSHRNHYHYLLSGGSPARLETLIREGNSMFVFENAERGARSAERNCEVNFLSSSILAGTCAIAAGVAWEMHEEGGRRKEGAYRLHLATGCNGGNCNKFKNDGNGRFRHYTREEFMANEWAWKIWSPRVWCFLGDGAEDEGHFYEAARLVEGHGLPCTFIIEDNDRSVDTSKMQRRGAVQWPSSIKAPLVRRYFYTPTYPHAGSGCGHQIEFRSQKSGVGRETQP